MRDLDAGISLPACRYADPAVAAVENVCLIVQFRKLGAMA
jgi:hypothetical protein